MGIIITLLLLISPVLAFAQGSSGGLDGSSGGLNGSSDGSSGFEFANPLNVNTFCDLLKAIFNVLVLFAIPIAVVMIVLAGFKFVLARGNPEGINKAKTNMIWTIIGIALFFGAWFLAQVIANTLVQLGGNSFDTCF